MSFFQVGWSPIMTIKSQVLALKYRPQIFKDLIGHEEIATTIQNSIKNNSSANAFLFKLRDKPAALYSALSGFAINGVNMTKLQSFPEKNSFSSFFFLCDIDGHLDEIKIKNSLEELAFHCEDMHVLGVYKAHNFREKK